MHADLVKLLDLQSKDAAVAAAGARLRALDGESAVLDQAIQRARDALDAARRAAADGARRRDEIEARVESYRTLQDRRVQRLETVRNPKDASTLMAELDLARSGVCSRSAEATLLSSSLTLRSSAVTASALRTHSVSSLAMTERARSSSAIRVEASFGLRTVSSRWTRRSCSVR